MSPLEAIDMACIGHTVKWLIPGSCTNYLAKGVFILVVRIHPEFRQTGQLTGYKETMFFLRYPPSWVVFFFVNSSRHCMTFVCVL